MVATTIHVHELSLHPRPACHARKIPEVNDSAVAAVGARVCVGRLRVADMCVLALSAISALPSLEGEAHPGDETAFTIIPTVAATMRGRI